MKTNYSIKNFRVFDNKGVTVELAPLTFLVGCNSSGKSSIVKSLSLLKTFFKNKFDQEHPVIGSTIDFTVKPNDSLGTFNNVVRSSSRKKEFSLSYEVHSDYINEDVVVNLTMGNGELGNAKISAIKISKRDGTVLVAANSGASFCTGNLAPIKEAFKWYLIATRYRADVEALLPSDPDINISPESEKKIKALKEKALQYCSSEYLYEVCKNRFVQISLSDKYVKPAIDKYAETGIMTYFSIFDEMRDLSSSAEISYYLKSKVKDGDLHDTMMKVIDYVSRDYAKSAFSDFLTYYRSLEDASIMTATEISPRVLVGGHEGLSLSSFLSSNRIDSIYSVADNEEWMEKSERFSLVHDMLSQLVEEEPYSYVLLGEFSYNPHDRRIHPLYLDIFNDFVERFCLEVVSKDITEGLDYISSSRIQVRRMYPMEDRNEFSNAVRTYFETKNKYMSLNPPVSMNVLNEDGVGFHSVEVTDFIPGSFMNKWMKVFRIGDHMSLEMDKNGLGLMLKVYPTESNSKGVLLADLGYGITQLFSILLQIEEMIISSLYSRFKDLAGIYGGTKIFSEYTNKPLDSKTVAIEEPEIHLHPKYQSLLAEMFYEAYKEYNIQFIIETHSEYLLRKIQTFVSAKKLAPNEVSMIYVEDDVDVRKGAQKVRRIPVKEDGRLAAPFGPGFYDEADNLSLELFTNMGR